MKFSREPEDPIDAHRPIKPSVRLDEVLCEQERRVVGNDWCVRWNNRWLQIDRRDQALALPAREILLLQKRDGSVYRDPWHPIPATRRSTPR